MTSRIATALRTLAVLVVILAIADVIGVIICTLFDITPLRFKSAMLPYAIWLVLGLFSGIFIFTIAGDWSSPPRPDGSDWIAAPTGRSTGFTVAAASTACVAGLIWFFNDLYWSKGVNGEYFVPDSAPHSLVFLLSALAAIIGTHVLLQRPG